MWWCPMAVRSLLWFYVGFVLVNFASSLWLLLSSVLTVMPIPLPYWLLYTPGNVVTAGMIVVALMLALYTYLGVVLVLGKLHRGFVPITMVIAFTIGSALLLAKLANTCISRLDNCIRNAYRHVRSAD
ncbi:MAG: hypothetical protein AT714_02370 [Vulcanisaeta sp. OSP_8]|nr:MAG: hypothetical protein AT714_02370 [Vulcanisaeta sp. OSP_8]